MEYPLLCSVTAGMLIKKGGFVMCKRKIKTIEAIFFLFLFSVIVLLLPQDAHARVRVVTKGTTSTIRDTDGVIEDEFSDINFPINIKKCKLPKTGLCRDSSCKLLFTQGSHPKKHHIFHRWDQCG